MCYVNVEFIDSSATKTFLGKKKEALVKEGSTVNRRIQAPGRWLSRQSRHWRHSIIKKKKHPQHLRFRLLSAVSETQLCDHWQTPAPNTAIFPPCHQMVPLRVRCTLFVFYLAPRVVIESLMIIKHLLGKIKQTETLAGPLN